METEVEKSLSKPVSHRKIAIGAWILALAILLIDLFLVYWTHTYRPDLYEFVVHTALYVGIVAFFLLLLSFALNRWKSILRQ